MVSILTLWLPILLSAVFVFIISSIIHMALPYHRSDYIKVPDEDAFIESVGKLDIPPGDYVVPHAGSMSEMNSPEFAEKAKKGPALFMTVMKGNPREMGLSLLMWFLYSVIISILAAYIASRTVPMGGRFLAVFRFAATVSFMAYALALAQNSIWFKKKWSTTFKSMFDGLIYAIVTGLTFAWLWPGLPA